MRHGRTVTTCSPTASPMPTLRRPASPRRAVGLALSVATPWGRGSLATRLVGAFNASNVLGCLAVLLASEIPLADALAALAEVEPPPGRMQRLGGHDAPLVVVDYAHTPDALEKVLLALRPAVTEGRELVCVFGCGGDRDAGKRPLMGAIAATLADRVDRDQRQPAQRGSRGDRRARSCTAFARRAIAGGASTSTVRRPSTRRSRGAKAGDVVLVAGKGHEDYQETNGARTPFSDADAAAAALARRGAG